MSLRFVVLSKNDQFPQSGKDVIFLKESNWDDFGYKTIFHIMFYDEHSARHDFGNAKIGYLSQSEGWTSQKLERKFDKFEENFFSLGQDADYYQKIMNDLSEQTSSKYLKAMRDIVYDKELFTLVESDAQSLSDSNKSSVYIVSMLRDLSASVIRNQFSRILQNGIPLTPYSFLFKRNKTEKYSKVELHFEVDPDLKPSTNIHILIGRNGVGKTTILNDMVKAIVREEHDISTDGFFQKLRFNLNMPIDSDYFTAVVSVSFSAFDPFIPPDARIEPSKGPRYNYVGLKRIITNNGRNEILIKSTEDLHQEMISSLKNCMSLSGKRERWINALNQLDADNNFSDISLSDIESDFDSDETEDKSVFEEKVSPIFKSLSSGHAIVLLTLTRLVELVEEKTLVLIDEPESHLHPPLLSAFTRALSDLLLNRNGVAILATHSPVVLQEAPKSCVSVIRRTRMSCVVDKPLIETFGENVGVLTREVFGLEVSSSGFYDVLAAEAKSGLNYDDIINLYGDQIGFEGKAILRAILSNKRNTFN
ncbi:ATP-binding protein [Klebsiella michiganensis]|uniref:AAA family ATPase n=1 Tax=Klebsiella michiganensis TaxID=1134687 RepID=UPI002DBAE230|nr:AAA family ATPase [Klebsiella michiganensis]MEB8078669.1 ATP-binding protein [Klebsiella michiganensis]